MVDDENRIWVSGLSVDNRMYDFYKQNIIFMKDLDRKLRKKLESKEQKIKKKELREKHENKYVTATIIFFGTLIPLYLLFFFTMYIFMRFYGSAVNMLGGSIAWILPLIHGAIWIAAVISVYRKRSVLDDFLDRF